MKTINKQDCPNFSEFFGDMDFRLKLKSCFTTSKGESEMISQLRVGMGSWQELREKHETFLCHCLSLGVRMTHALHSLHTGGGRETA